MGNDKYKEIINKYYDKQEKKKEKILEKEEDEKNNNIKKTKTEIKNIEIVNNKNPKKIFKSPTINNKKLKSQKPIKYDLYSPKKEEKSKNYLSENNNKEINKERKKNFDRNAKDIIKKIKDYKFKEIFDLLDNNKEGFLSYSNISFINIEPKMLEALSPLIGEIYRNKNKKIFFNEFKNITSESLSKCMMEDV